MSKFCSNCGEQVEENINFCLACGEKIYDSTEENIYTENSVHVEHFVPDSGIVQMFFSQKGRLNRARYFQRFFILSIIGSIVNLTSEYLPISFDAIDNITLTAGAGQLWYIYFSSDVDKFLYSNNPYDLIDGKYFGMLIACLIFNFCILIYLLFKGGTRGANKFGPDPLENVR